MEIELDLRSHRKPLWIGLSAGAAILGLVVFAALGAPLTPHTEAGAPCLLGWSDWRFFQAEKAYQEELQLLRSSASQLAEALETSPNPVALQILADRILRQTESGDAALSAARAALAQAARDVRDWSAGILRRDQAIASLQLAMGLLQ